MLILDFPEEIVSLILIRLSVKTLSVLKCVNTYFSRFVSCPYFIKDHGEFSIHDPSMCSYNVMFQDFFTDEKIRQTSIWSLWRESSVSINYLDYPKANYGLEDVLLVGSCNGLVVIIVDYRHMFIWNPTIRKHEKLPTIVGHNKYGTRFYWGFGFDASNDDYKVVAISTISNRPNSMAKRDFCYEVNVYSLNRNSWIRISDFTAGEFTDECGMLASGKLHWCNTNGDIVSFDVEREVFETVEQPTYTEGCSRVVKLSVLGGSFCLCCDYNDEHVDVWVMKEYGIKLSWTKVFTISADSQIHYITRPHFIMPNGEVLIADANRFLFYNPKVKSLRSNEIFFDCFHDPVLYVESLVSPCCNRRQETS